MSIKIQVEDTVIFVNQEFAAHSQLIQNFSDQKTEECIVLSKQFVDKQCWDIIAAYYKINNYQPKKVIVNSHDETKVFSKEDLQILYMIRASNIAIQKLILAATYLNTPLFYDLLISKLAVDFYVDPSNPKQSMERLLKTYPQVPRVTKEEIKEYQGILQYFL